MALSDVMKKKQVVNDSSPKKEKKNILDDVRVFIAILAVACIGLIALTVLGVTTINETLENIESAKADYKTNQTAIANLLALQSRSSEYKQQRDEYVAMISEEALDQQQIMIEMETSVESHNCLLTNLSFGEATNTGVVNQQTVVINITGTYDNIMRFCQDTVTQQQIKRIDGIKMTEESSSNGKQSLKTAEITVVLFSK